MDRLEGWLTRRRRLVVALWLVTLVAAAPFAARQTEHLTAGGFKVPGSGSAKVEEALADFERAEREPLSVVLALRPQGDAAAVRAAIDRVRAVAAELEDVELPAEAVAAAKREAGTKPITIVPLIAEGPTESVVDLAVALRDRLGAGEARDGVETYVAGQAALFAGLQDLTKEDLREAELRGFPAVLVVLLAVFGSLAAAALPLALGFASVLITGAIVFFLSQAMDMSVLVTNAASMIGIGVAVDYSLFVLARYREEVRAGAPPDEARRVSLRTSGIAVAFSGLTVMISLAGLFLAPSQAIRSMAVGAIVAVGIAVLAAVGLLPVLIRLLGRRAYARGRVALTLELVWRRLRSRPRRRGSTAPGRPRRPDFWTRWTERVIRRPVLSAALSAALLAALAIPAFSLKLGDGSLQQLPAGHDARVGAELAAKAEGPGASGPTWVVARFDRGGWADRLNRAAVARWIGAVERDPAVAEVAPPQPSRDGRSVLLTVVPAADPEGPVAGALLDRLRAAADGGRGLAAVADVEVGGGTAYVEDFKDLVFGSMWKVGLFVAVFSYLVLLVLLRSVVLPLKAVVMNLLSVGAAYGVLVAVFQYGWLDDLLGYDSLGYIHTMTPLFLLAIVFGLSMDYEVFLLTRVRERYDATGDTRAAIAQGLRASARTISSAALIMVVVFGIFAGTGVPAIKELGLGLAVAIAIDATIVRLVLVPAAMQILGRWNWWLPRPLARVLPAADFEADAPAPAAPAPAPEAGVAAPAGRRAA